MAETLIKLPPSGAEIYARLKVVMDRERHQRGEMKKVMHALDHRFDKIDSSYFADDGASSGLIISNTLELAASSYGVRLAVMPTISVIPSADASNIEVKRALKRSKIASAYATASNFQMLRQRQSKRYVSYGFAAYKVVPDFEQSMPVIVDVDPFGCYWERARNGKLREFWETRTYSKEEIKQFFPGSAPSIDADRSDRKELRVIFYQNNEWDMILTEIDRSFNGNAQRIILSQEENKAGEVLAQVSENYMNATNQRHGMFDGVINILLARHDLSRMVLKQIKKNVDAPLIVDQSVNYMEWGGEFIIKSDNPGAVGYAKTNDTSVQLAANENQILGQEAMTAGQYSQVMQGESDASIITGAGVKALAQPASFTIRNFQAVDAFVTSELFRMSFKADELWFGSEEKTVNIVDSDVYEELVYIPKKDIAGKHTVNVKFGMTSGMSAENSVVAIQQLQQSKFISRRTAQRELPMEINPEEETRLSQQESLEDTTLLALQQTALTIPGMVQQGQDPTTLFAALAAARDAISKGTDPITAVAAAMAPPKPSPEEMAAMQQAQAGAGADPSAAGADGGLGLLAGQAAGAQGASPGSKPTMRNIIASLDSSGRARSSVSVQSRQAV